MYSRGSAGYCVRRVVAGARGRIGRPERGAESPGGRRGQLSSPSPSGSSPCGFGCDTLLVVVAVIAMFLTMCLFTFMSWMNAKDSWTGPAPNVGSYASLIGAGNPDVSNIAIGSSNADADLPARIEDRDAVTLIGGPGGEPS